MDIEWLARASVPAEPDSPREQRGESAAWSEDFVRERDFAKSRRSEGRGAARKRGFAPMPDAGPQGNSRHQHSAATRRLRVLDLPAGNKPNRIPLQPATREQPPAENSTPPEKTAIVLLLN